MARRCQRRALCFSRQQRQPDRWCQLHWLSMCERALGFAFLTQRVKLPGSLNPCVLAALRLCVDSTVFFGIKGERRFLWHRLLIDNRNEEEFVCQNGPLEGILEATRPPPFPHLSPSVPPPYTLPTQTVTISVPSWHSSGCPRHSQAGGCGRVLKQRFRLVNALEHHRRTQTNQDTAAGFWVCFALLRITAQGGGEWCAAWGHAAYRIGG